MLQKVVEALVASPLHPVDILAGPFVEVDALNLNDPIELPEGSCTVEAEEYGKR